MHRYPTPTTDPKHESRTNIGPLDEASHECLVDGYARASMDQSKDSQKHWNQFESPAAKRDALATSEFMDSDMFGWWYWYWCLYWCLYW